jgi:hypothetical protein
LLLIPISHLLLDPIRGYVLNRFVNTRVFP